MWKWTVQKASMVAITRRLPLKCHLQRLGKLESVECRACEEAYEVFERNLSPNHYTDAEDANANIYIAYVEYFELDIFLE